MNIFVTSSCPVDSARALDDKRVNKMILESAQMLSAAMHVNGTAGPYKIAFKNHPCTKWASSKRANFNWLLDHLEALAKEWEFRRGKIHSVSRLIPTFVRAANNIPVGDGNIDAFVNATPFKFVDDVHLAYKLALVNKWLNLDKRVPVWTDRDRPIWYDDVIISLPEYIDRMDT